MVSLLPTLIFSVTNVFFTAKNLPHFVILRTFSLYPGGDGAFYYPN